MKTLVQKDLHKKIIANCIIEKINNLYLISLEENIDRQTYNDIKKVFNRLSIKWNSKTEQHTSREDPTDAIALYLDSGYLPPLNPYAYFPTPFDTVKQAIEITDIPSHRSNLRFLEPSAGCGRIAELIRIAYPTMQIDCIELDPKHRNTLLQKGFNIVTNDFEQYKCDILYDVIIMNPPFQGITYQKHIHKAWEMLADGGLLTAIIPYDYRKYVNFRNWIFEFGSTTYIGNVFDKTSIECEIINLVKSNSAFLWQPVCEFRSSYHREVQLLIDSDYTLSQLKVADFDRIDKAINNKIEKGFNLVWNDTIKTQVKTYLHKNDE